MEVAYITLQAVSIFAGSNAIDRVQEQRDRLAFIERARYIKLRKGFNNDSSRYIDLVVISCQ